MICDGGVITGFVRSNVYPSGWKKDPPPLSPWFLSQQIYTSHAALNAAVSKSTWCRALWKGAGTTRLPVIHLPAAFPWQQRRYFNFIASRRPSCHSVSAPGGSLKINSAASRRWVWILFPNSHLLPWIKRCQRLLRDAFHVNNHSRRTSRRTLHEVDNTKATWRSVAVPPRLSSPPLG